MFNLNSTHTLTLEGVIKALSPIAIKPHTADVATMPLDGGETCHIPATTIRGKLRHTCVKQMMATDHQQGKPWTLDYAYETLIGQTAKSEQKKEGVIELGVIEKARAKNPVVGVFGSGIEVPSSLLVSNAIPASLVAPVYIPAVRKDLDAATASILPKASQDEWLARNGNNTKRVQFEAQLTTARRAAKNATGEEKDALDSKVLRLTDMLGAIKDAMGEMENSSQGLYGYLAMPAGTECNVRMDLKEPSEAMEMVLLGALFNFAHEPLLGGQIARGCGRVSVSLGVERRRGVGVDTLGTLVISGAGEAPEFLAASDEARAWYDERIAAWRKRNEVDSEAA